MNKLLKQAFTLIELLVVIAIIGILSGLIVVSMSGVTQKANVAKAQVFSNSLRNSLMLNLVSEWKFDDGLSSTQTITNDSWGGGSNGSLTNFNFNTTDGWRSDSQCVSGGCLQFDGTDDYIDLANVNGLNNINYPFTVEFWVNPIYTGSGMVIWGGFETNGSTKNFIRLDASSSQVTFDQYAPSGGGAALGPALSSNQWHHVALSMTSSLYQFYIDGTLYPYSTIEIYSGLTPTQWNIGRRYITLLGTNYFKGYLDNFRLYNSNVGTSYIREQYYAGLNSLLASGAISSKEYMGRIDYLANF
jgi:prepilin-type N-terminal cleavage/methylation domain-containing protein